MKFSIAALGALLLLPGAAWAQGQTVADVVKLAKDKEHDGDWKGAIAYYDAILQQFPKQFPEIYAERATDLGIADDDKDALADYTKALALDNDPKNQVLNHDVILSERAQVKRNLGDVKGAIADYHASLKIKPGDSFTIANLAEVELDAEDCAGANNDYSQAIVLAQTPEVLYLENRGIARLCLGDIANSYSDHQEAVTLDLKGTQPVLFGQPYLDAWALGVRLGRKADADTALSDQLAATKEEESIERTVGNYFLGRADVAAVNKAAQAGDKDNGDDTWTGFSYYCIGLKQMADGDNKAAIASFQQLLAAKHHFVNTQLEARSWIRILTTKKK